MARNLHISYDLSKPGQNYSGLIDAIKSLGAWAHINESFWFVNCSKSPREVCDALQKHLDSNDSIYVVDAKNNVAAWNNLSDEVSSFVRDNWSI
ncbi:CRISPR-associated protein Cas2 [Cohaesibacter marisflavi]|uniref:CRISPR-associated protein Cas2 n=1 Tax=Cohaesibacter marisflavi TaxID=655353 RepID=UPI0029C87541|nr:CRISPR-associated protein Cas2 [Cohaesibacter marisflavi]